MLHPSAFVRIGLLVALLLTAGCTVLRTRIGTPVDPERIPPGEQACHYRDILKKFGPPSRISTTRNDLLFLYEFTELRENQIGLSFDIDWLRLFKLSLGKAHANRQTALMIFDETGLLQSSGFYEWTEDLGDGASVQLIVSVVNVVDTEEYEVDAYQHLWGAALLEPYLSAGLNRQNDLNSGEEGLEQLATPHWAGQHTLAQ